MHDFFARSVEAFSSLVCTLNSTQSLIASLQSGHKLNYNNNNNNKQTFQNAKLTLKVAQARAVAITKNMLITKQKSLQQLSDKVKQ